MKKILLVEDSKEVHQMVEMALSSIANMDYTMLHSEAIEKINSNSYDLIILDIELPDGSGLDLCSYILQKTPDTPVFFLSSHDQLADKVIGFSAGADDYITKPFDMLEFKARVEGKLKKMDILIKASDLLRWKEIEIDKSKQEVKVLTDGKLENVELTALEFKLLTLFASRDHQVIARDEILDQIWGKDVHVYSRSVDTHVSKLRKKLDACPDLIQSVHGAGYKFCPSS